MKIPFEDRRDNMKRRWTDIKKINNFRFYEFLELIEDCHELGKDEFLQLQGIIEKKLTGFTTSQKAH